MRKLRCTRYEDPYNGDGYILQGIARDVGFHLVHEVGVEALTVVQLEYLPASMGWNCEVVLAGKKVLCGLTLDLSMVDHVHRLVVHEQQNLSSMRIFVRSELFDPLFEQWDCHPGFSLTAVRYQEFALVSPIKARVFSLFQIIKGFSFYPIQETVRDVARISPLGGGQSKSPGRELLPAGGRCKAPSRAQGRSSWKLTVFIS